jgi:uncharacterized protein (DUF1684 family)
MGVLLILALLASDASYRQEMERWRQQREARLKSDDGWLTVTGLFFLKEGINRIGTAAGDDVSLPAGAAPERVGAIEVAGRQVRFRAAAPGAATLNGQPVQSAELHPDTAPKPDVLAAGRVRLLLIERDGRYAIRLKDPGSDLRKRFTGERWFPVDERWRIRARFVPYPAPKKVAFDTVIGGHDEMESPGYATFTVEGKEYRLEPVREGDTLFFVFRDATAGKTTYGAGRFLNTAPPRDGMVLLDFNQAVNPPCAFTPYATCPLPPRQNRLPIEITAGEMKYPGSH